MKTRIMHERGRIKLVIDDPAKPKGEKDVLAAMTLFEGTGCWQLVDVRLSKHRQPNPYAGSLNADVFCASFTPVIKKDADHVKSLLREFKELPSGEILWCTFDGVVRGSPEVNGYKPKRWADFDQAGYFSRADGLAELHKIKEFWDDIDSLDSDWRIENPHRQPSENEIVFALVCRKHNIKPNEAVEEGGDEPGSRLV